MGYLLAANFKSSAHLIRHISLNRTPLNPCFTIAEETLVLSTQFMAAVPANILKHPLTSLSGKRDDIVAAIDLLMQGF